MSKKKTDWAEVAFGSALVVVGILAAPEDLLIPSGLGVGLIAHGFGYL